MRTIRNTCPVSCRANNAGYALRVLSLHICAHKKQITRTPQTYEVGQVVLLLLCAAAAVGTFCTVVEACIPRCMVRGRRQNGPGPYLLPTRQAIFAVKWGTAIYVSNRGTYTPGSIYRDIDWLLRIKTTTTTTTLLQHKRAESSYKTKHFFSNSWNKTKTDKSKQTSKRKKKKKPKSRESNMRCERPASGTFFCKLTRGRNTRYQDAIPGNSKNDVIPD